VRFRSSPVSLRIAEAGGNVGGGDRERHARSGVSVSVSTTEQTSGSRRKAANGGQPTTAGFAKARATFGLQTSSWARGGGCCVARATRGQRRGGDTSERPGGVSRARFSERMPGSDGGYGHLRGRPAFGPGRVDSVRSTELQRVEHRRNALPGGSRSGSQPTCFFDRGLHPTVGKGHRRWQHRRPEPLNRAFVRRESRRESVGVANRPKALRSSRQAPVRSARRVSADTGGSHFGGSRGQAATRGTRGRPKRDEGRSRPESALQARPSQGGTFGSASGRRRRRNAEGAPWTSRHSSLSRVRADAEGESGRESAGAGNGDGDDSRARVQRESRVGGSPPARPVATPESTVRGPSLSGDHSRKGGWKPRSSNVSCVTSPVTVVVTPPRWSPVGPGGRQCGNTRAAPGFHAGLEHSRAFVHGRTEETEGVSRDPGGNPAGSALHRGGRPLQRTLRSAGTRASCMAGSVRIDSRRQRRGGVPTEACRAGHSRSCCDGERVPSLSSQRRRRATVGGGGVSNR
jgi:hypothetical protein